MKNLYGRKRRITIDRSTQVLQRSSMHPFFASSYDIDSRVQPSFFARFHGEVDFSTKPTILLYVIFRFIFRRTWNGK